MRFKTVLSVVLIGLVLLFVAQNLALIEFTVGVWTVTLPRSLVLFSALGAGIVLGYLWRGHRR